MQNCAAPSDDAAWRMRFSCTKCCASSSPRSMRSEHRVGADAHVRERHLRMIGRHVERPPEELDLESRRVGRDEKGADPLRIAGLAAGASEDDVVGRVMQAAVPPFHTVEHPLVAIAYGGGLHVGRVAAVVRLGQAERQAPRAVEKARHPRRDLLGRAEVAHHQHGRKVADDATTRSAGRCATRGLLVAKCSRMIAISRLRRVAAHRTRRAAQAVTSRRHRHAGASR